MNINLALDGMEAAQNTLARLRHLFVAQDEINAAVELAGMAAVKDHLTEHYATRPNKLGAPSTGFYRKVLESAEATSDGTNVTISLTQVGLRLRYYGGIVRPTGRISEVTGKPIKFLAFPVVPEAHGKVPAEMPGLYWRPGGLFRMEGPKKATTDPRIFALARQTTHLPDPQILPPPATVLEATAVALGDLLAATIDAPQP